MATAFLLGYIQSLPQRLFTLCGTAHEHSASDGDPCFSLSPNAQSRWNHPILFGFFPASLPHEGSRLSGLRI